jgi:polar amino acid transport system permease protein
MNEGIDMFFDWLFPLTHMNELLSGALITLLVTLVTFIVAFLLGIILGVARYESPRNLLSKLFYYLATIYIETIRNTPALVQIYLIYFGLPEFGISLKPIVAGILALVINNSAFIAEVVRGGLQSIPKGQHEAAESIGLDALQIFKLIIFPQAVRNIFPALGNQVLMIVFCTALLSIIDVRELTDVALILNADTCRTMEIFITITCMYFIMTMFISRIMAYINQKFFPLRV